jgi:hypothetical protein
MSTSTRPVQNLRKHPKVTELVKRRAGYITDLGGKHEIKLEWKLNEAAQRDKVFKLTIDDKEVFVDLEELTFYTRVMFN